MKTAESVATSKSTSAGDWRELASRGGDGLEITLLWSKATGVVKVAVADSRCDEEFEFEVGGADALAAFHHPFAFAGDLGTRSGELAGVSNHLQPQS
jgi:hypothetical protein